MNTDFQPKVTSFKTTDKNTFERVRKIRETVFVIEQEVAEEEEFDEFEDESTHYLAEINGKAVGTARWRHIGEKIKLERFAVLKEFRNQKVGEALLSAVLTDVKPLNKPLYLHAQLPAMNFYARQGFKQVGELFLECEIEHYKMVKES